MKKTLTGATICALNLGTVCATLVPQNNGEIASYRESTGAVARQVRSVGINGDNAIGRQGEAVQINLRTVRSPSIQGDRVIVQVRDCRDNNGNLIALSDWYTRDYPLQRTTINFEHDFANGVSHPIERLYTNIDDLQFADRHGEIVVDDEFVNTSRSFQHYRRETGRYEMDDNNLKAQPYMETYINVDGNDMVLNTSLGNDSVAYTRTGNARTNNLDLQEYDSYNWQRTETFEDWQRPNGTIFTQRTESGYKIEKPRPPAPQPAPQPHVVNQPAPVEHHRPPIESRIWHHPFNPGKWF